MRVSKRQTKLDEIFDKNGTIKELKDNYSPRESQISAAHSILASFYDGQNAIIEGPCGFGKTFAYLVPSFEYIIKKETSSMPIEIEDGEDVRNATVEREKAKVLIATNGISLQEQLINFDIPFVAKVFKHAYPEARKLNYAIFKGRQNFICKRKLSLRYSQVMSCIEDTDQANEFNEFVSTTKTGDFSELSFVPKQDILSECCCQNPDDCEGRKCPMFGSCFYQQHKKQAFDADIVVCNYHLLFTGLKIPVLPDFDILVMDEAHEAADILRNFDTVTFNLGSCIKIQKDLASIFKSSCVVDIVEAFSEKRRNEIFCDNVKDYEKPYKKLYEILEKAAFAYTSRVVNFSKFEMQNLIPQTYIFDKNLNEIDSEDVRSALSGLSNMLNVFVGILESKIDDGGFDEEQDKNDAETMCKKCTTLMKRFSEISSMLLASDEEDDEFVFWAEKKEQRNSVVISVCKRPIKVGKILNRAFFANPQITSTVITSATLSVDEKFSYIKSELGLDIENDKDDEAVCDKKLFEFVGSSPFNLKEQELWYLPIDAVDGNKQGFKEYFTELSSEIAQISKGGVLFLTTSVSQMNSCYNAVRNMVLSSGLDYLVLKQGDAPRLRLLKEFKENTDSILVATKSFFTGVDIPGDALRFLVIDKFPFASPDDPVMHKLCLEPGGFFKYSIPQMVISLKQAVGRGIRSIDDKCVICIADGRMATARYRAAIHRSFTYEKTATRDVNDVIEFLDK